MTINDRIKEVRKGANMNQLDFGKSIGVSESAISNYESGRRAISEQTAQLICRVHHINYEWLINGIGDMKTDSQEEQLLALLKDSYSLSDLDIKIIKGYLQLTVEERNAFVELVKKIKDA